MMSLNYLGIILIGGVIFVAVWWLSAEKRDSQKSLRLLLGLITMLGSFFLGIGGADLSNKVDEHYSSNFLSMTFKNLEIMLKHDRKEKVQKLLCQLKRESRFDMDVTGRYFSKTKEIVKNIENDKTK